MYDTLPKDIQVIRHDAFSSIQEYVYFCQELAKQTEWDTEDVTLDFVFDNGLNKLLVDLENST